MAINALRHGATALPQTIAHLKCWPYNLLAIFNTSVTIKLSVLLPLINICLMFCPVLHNPKQITLRKLDII